MQINVLTQFVLIVFFSLTIHLFSLLFLAVFALLLISFFVYDKNTHFFKLIQKLKWLFLVMLLLFMMNTPGEHIASWPFEMFSITYEGLHLGLKQVLRITLMLAAISVLLTNNTKQALSSGFYFLSYPLQYVGLDPKRFAARLLLTLHYVELQQSESNKASIRDRLSKGFEALFIDSEDEDVTITLTKPVFILLDYLLLLLCFAFVINFLFRGT